MLTISQKVKKTQIDRILQSYKLSSNVKFPARISIHSFSTMDIFLLIIHI